MSAPRLDQNQVSHRGRGKRSSLGRHLITDTCSLSVQGRGSRSWSLVDWIVCCVWKSNCWNILWLLDFSMFVFQTSQFLMICLDKVCWDGDRTGRESRGWGRFWMSKVTSRSQLRVGNWRISERGTGGSCTLNVSTEHPYLSTRISYSLLNWRRSDVVHVSGSYTTWFGSPS